MTKFQRSTIALGIAALTSGWLGCQSFNIQTDHDPAVDFTALKTYAWQPESAPRAGDPRTHNVLVDARVRDAVNAEFAAMPPGSSRQVS